MKHIHAAKRMAIAIALVGASLPAMSQGVDRVFRSYQENPILPLGLEMPKTGPEKNVANVDITGAAPTDANGVVQAEGPKEVPVPMDLQNLIWDVNVSDRSVRKVIERWSGIAQWNFGFEHWTVDRDFPVLADTKVAGAFKNAVRDLLASTDFTDLPLQPCFYANKVLRVITKNEKCDRLAVAD